MTNPFGHCSDELLIDITAGACTPGQVEAVEFHVAACISCRQRRDEYASLVANLSSVETWTGEQAIEQLREEAKRQEAAAASGIERLLGLIALPANQWRTQVLADTDLRTPAVVNGLLDLLGDRTNLPTRTYEIATLAADIADLLPLDREGRRVRWRAWSAHASALIDTGRYREALAALDLADSLCGGLVDSDLLTALDDYLRADVLRQIDEPAKATACIRSAATVFERYHDTRHLVYARFMEAGIAYRQRDYGETLHTLLNLIEPLKSVGDAPALAQLYLTVGQCFFFTGEYDVAEVYLAEAEAGFRSHGMLQSCVKVEWGMARVMIATGRKAAGIRELRRVSKRFEALAMMGEWVPCALELVEAMIGSCASHRSVVTLCKRIANAAARGGMRAPYVEALSYLREAAIARCLTEPVARYVREYVADLAYYPSLPFLPPPM